MGSRRWVKRSRASWLAATQKKQSCFVPPRTCRKKKKNLTWADSCRGAAKVASERERERESETEVHVRKCASKRRRKGLAHMAPLRKRESRSTPFHGLVSLNVRKY